VNNLKNPYYLVLDQGTSSSKIFLFDDEQNIVFSDRERHRLNRPQEHHIESNPIDILNACTKLISAAISYSKSKNGKLRERLLAHILERQNTYTLQNTIAH
jgi:glycerol kinase